MKNINANSTSYLGKLVSNLLATDFKQVFFKIKRQFDKSDICYNLVDLFVTLAIGSNCFLLVTQHSILSAIFFTVIDIVVTLFETNSIIKETDKDRLSHLVYITTYDDLRKNYQSSSAWMQIIQEAESLIIDQIKTANLRIEPRKKVLIKSCKFLQKISYSYLAITGVYVFLQSSLKTKFRPIVVPTMNGIFIGITILLLIIINFTFYCKHTFTKCWLNQVAKSMANVLVNVKQEPTV